MYKIIVAKRNYDLYKRPVTTSRIKGT